jgi:hypothetical protein
MATDPLVHYGRHFGRVAYAFCNVKTLLTNGLERLANDGDDVGNLSARYASVRDPPKTNPLSWQLNRERREQSIFQDLLHLCHGFEERLVNASIEEVGMMADMVSISLQMAQSSLLALRSLQVQKGMNGSRADDTKGMKAAIIDWITPKGQTLIPPLNRKIKSDRGFHHERTGALLCPAGMDWSVPL